MPHVFKKDIPRNFPSTPACSDHESMLLSPREHMNGAAFGNAVFFYQPFRGGRIDQRHVDLITVLSAELLKRSVRNEWVKDLQFSRADKTLNLLDRNAEQISRTLPGVCIVLCH